MPAYVLEIAVLALGLILLLWEAFLAPDKRRWIGYAAIGGLALVFVLTFFAEMHPAEAGGFWSYYTADKLALFYKRLALLCTGVVLVLGLDFLPVLEKYSARVGGGAAIGEFFSLPVFICTGLMWMASAVDLTSIFVSLELVTIAFYVLVAYMRRNGGSLEAGAKYLILGALSTGFFVYGFAWLFGVTGQTNLAAIGHALATTSHHSAALFAFALVLVGIAFKVAAVPLQFWVPDVYQGAPTPVTAFLSVGSKAAGFIVAFRLLQPFLASDALSGPALSILVAVAGATLLVGNLAAIPQTNFKRLLAYSSISHAGFLLLALASKAPVGGLRPEQVVSFYLAAYLFMTLLCFAVLAIINRWKASDDLTAFDGLGQRSPFLAFALLIGSVSLAGVPLTAGFLGKFFVFTLAINSGYFWPTVVAILGAAAGFYYYLKVVRSMYLSKPAASDPALPTPLCPLTRITIIVLIAATLLFGVWPQPILSLL
ncbi:MAG: NADH-quinone oxidoreductase subunit N [Verrucomicrobiales bacterium]|nr:NADH-quinone oxidoreductase subunit N [Verrucomicrobiales bacterium]